MVYVSAGRRGIEIGLEPNLLIELTEATLGAFTNLNKVNQDCLRCFATQPKCLPSDSSAKRADSEANCLARVISSNNRWIPS